MPLPIPLNSYQGVTAQRAGTGFLVSSGEDVWLVTCVHIVTGMGDSPPDATPFLEAGLVCLGPSLYIPLILDGSQRFRYVIINPANTILDALAVKLSATEKAVLQYFGSYPISSVVAPLLGEAVTANGFPGLQVTPIPAITLQATVTKVQGVSIILSEPSAVGISGAALTSPRGLIGILTGDLGLLPNLTNAMALNFHDLSANLFL